jgi:hypothetical protein
MGRYMTVRFEGEGTALGEVLRPLFHVAAFRPVAAGGVASAGWLLAGYCLEDFVVRFSRGGVPSPDAIEPAVSGDPAEQRYLDDLRAQLGADGIAPSALSPFEQADEARGLTRVEDVALREPVLDAIDAWSERRHEPLVHCYGALPLALAGGGASGAFRFLFPAELELAVRGAPFLFVRAQARAGGRIEAAVHTESTVWLRAGEPEDADANLGRFAEIASALKRGMGPGATAQLQLDGYTFVRESDRLEAQIAQIAGPARRGW